MAKLYIDQAATIDYVWVEVICIVLFFLYASPVFLLEDSRKLCGQEDGDHIWPPCWEENVHFYR